MKSNSIIIVFIIFICPILKAQTAFVTTGGNIVGSDGIVSCSIGQVFYNTNSGTEGNVSEGVQQPYEISIISEKPSFINSIKIETYPNPTKDFITLKVEDYESLDLDIKLLGVNGNIIFSEQLLSNSTKIDMRDLAPATYILQIINHLDIIRSFKIIKNN